MRILAKTYLIVVLIIKKLLFLTEIFLFLRLLLKFFGANPQALVVDFLYRYSNFLVFPFDFIFPNIKWPEGYLIETPAICAMIGYALAVFILLRLLKIFSED